MGHIYRYVTVATIVSLLTVSMGFWLGSGVQANQSPPTQWSTPVAPLEVHRGFQPPPTPWAAGHRGVDLAGENEQPVHASAAGTVLYADYLADRGVVSIRHDSGWLTSYEPVRAEVTEGQQVEAGELLGVLDGVHRDCRSSAPCLHWGARLWGQYVDPLWLLGLGDIRLLPRPSAAVNP